MSLNYYDFLDVVTIDGYNLPDVFKNKRLYIENNQIIEKFININSRERIDNISSQNFDDELLYWLVLLLNNDTIDNPLILNLSNSDKYKSLVKTLIYNPVRFIRDFVVKKNRLLLNYLYQLQNDSEVSFTDAYTEDYIKTAFTAVEHLNDFLISNLPYKSEVDIDTDIEDGVNRLDNYRKLIYYILNTYNIPQNLVLFDSGTLNHESNANIQVTPSFSLQSDINLENDVDYIKFYMMFLVYWSIINT